MIDSCDCLSQASCSRVWLAIGSGGRMDETIITAQTLAPILEYLSFQNYKNSLVKHLLPCSSKSVIPFTVKHRPKKIIS